MIKSKEFRQKVVAAVKEILGNGYTVTITDTPKNNGILSGISIKKDDSNIAPVIYLEQLEKDYNDGVLLFRMLQNALSAFTDHTIQ